MKAAIEHVLFACLMLIVSSSPCSAASPEEFILKVTLDPVTLDPGVTTAIETIVVAQRAFDASKVVDGEKITIKGDLAAKQRDRYHLRLTLTERRNEKNNQSQICEFDVTPGKADRFGFISSVVYLRTVLLTPLPRAKHGR